MIDIIDILSVVVAALLIFLPIIGCLVKVVEHLIDYHYAAKIEYLKVLAGAISKSLDAMKKKIENE